MMLSVACAFVEYMQSQHASHQIINHHAFSNIKQVPQTLTKPGGYDHREALFGIPNYGGTLAQNLYYADDNNLCEASTIDTRSGFPIRATVSLCFFWVK